MNEANSPSLPMKGLQRNNSGDRFVLGLLSPDVGGSSKPVDDIIMPMRNLTLQKLHDSDMACDGTVSGTAPCTINSCAASSLLEDLNSESYDWNCYLQDPNGTYGMKKLRRKPSEAARLFLQNDEIPTRSTPHTRRSRKKSKAATLLLHNNYEGESNQNFMNATVQNDYGNKEIPEVKFHFDGRSDMDGAMDLSCVIHGTAMRSDQYGTNNSKVL